MIRWIGAPPSSSMQSFVSIGVNLGLLPTKGLTLPLISSGGSSILMTCVAMGLLLRVSYELERTERQVTLRGEAVQADARETESADMPVETQRVAPVVVAPSRGTSRLNSRVEPTFERIA